MLIEKLEQGENFTSHEKEVAQYILANPDKVPGMSSMELPGLLLPARLR